MRFEAEIKKWVSSAKRVERCRLSAFRVEKQRRFYTAMLHHQFYFIDIESTLRNARKIANSCHQSGNKECYFAKKNCQRCSVCNDCIRQSSAKYIIHKYVIVIYSSLSTNHMIGRPANFYTLYLSQMFAPTIPVITYVSPGREWMPLNANASLDLLFNRTRRHVRLNLFSTILQ